MTSSPPAQPSTRPPALSLSRERQKRSTAWSWPELFEDIKELIRLFQKEEVSFLGGRDESPGEENLLKEIFPLVIFRRRRCAGINEDPVHFLNNP